MKPLAKTNKYLRSGDLDEIIRRNAITSSAFEGASPKALQAVRDKYDKTRASPKKPAKSPKSNG